MKQQQEVICSHSKISTFLEEIITQELAKIAQNREEPLSQELLKEIAGTIATLILEKISKTKSNVIRT